MTGAPSPLTRKVEMLSDIRGKWISLDRVTLAIAARTVNPGHPVDTRSLRDKLDRHKFFEERGWLLVWADDFAAGVDAWSENRA